MVLQSKLTEWLAYRQTCLDELLRHDGRESSVKQDHCRTCDKNDASWKCLDCIDGGLLRCQACLVISHNCHPLHRIEVCLLLLPVMHSFLTSVEMEWIFFPEIVPPRGRASHSAWTWGCTVCFTDARN